MLVFTRKQEIVVATNIFKSLLCTFDIMLLFCVSTTPSSSGCPEAVKLLVGNKSDLPAEVDISQAKVRML